MPIVERTTTLRATPEQAFDLSQSYELRLDWDPFVKEQHPMDGASLPGKGVRTHTKSRHGLVMVSEYLTFHRPTLVGMKMVKGPPFFRLFSGSWRFTAVDTNPQRPLTEVVFRYNFACRPKFLQPIMDRVGTWYLGRDIQNRITAFKNAIETTDILTKLPQHPADTTPQADTAPPADTAPQADTAPHADTAPPAEPDQPRGTSAN